MNLKELNNMQLISGKSTKQYNGRYMDMIGLSILQIENLNVKIWETINSIIWIK